VPLVFIAYAVVSSLFAAVLLLSAFGFATKDEKITHHAGKSGVTDQWFPRLAALKAAGAAGLVAGLWVYQLGVAAAIGLALYFLGAFIAHVRARYFQAGSVVTVVLFCLIGAAAAVLRLASS
jgi:hypothetical protein